MQSIVTKLCETIMCAGEKHICMGSTCTLDCASSARQHPPTCMHRNLRRFKVGKLACYLYNHRLHHYGTTGLDIQLASWLAQTLGHKPGGKKRWHSRGWPSRPASLPRIMEERPSSCSLCVGGKVGKKVELLCDCTRRTTPSACKASTPRSQ